MKAWNKTEERVKRPALWALGCVVLAILLTYYEAPFWLYAFPVMLLLVLPFAVDGLDFRRTAVFGLVYLLTVFVSLSAFSIGNVIAPWDGSIVTVSGVVDSVPGESEKKDSFLLAVRQIEGQNTATRIAVSDYTDNAERKAVKPGDVVRIKGRLRLPDAGRNPGGFNYRLYLLGQRVAGVMSVSDAENMTVLGSAPSVIHRIEGLRIRLSESVDRAFAPEEAALIRGILFGDKTISDRVQTLFSDAGLSHVLAVSGLHVGFLFAVIAWILSRLKLKEKYYFPVLLPLLVFYIVLTGMSASVVRASLMLTAVVLGRVVKRHYDMLSGIAVAAIIILIASPAQLFAAGFQMSFGAVIGICFFFKPLCHLIEKHVKKPGSLLSALVLTLCATAGTLPATLYHFQTVNLIGFLTNPVVVPIVGVLLTLCFVAVPLMTLLPPLAPVLAFVPSVIAKIIIALTGFFASFDFLRFHRGALNVWEFAMIALLMFLIAGYFNVKRMKPTIAASALVSVCVIGIVVMAIWPKPFTVTYLDVGQGDAALVETPAGGAYLIDGGGYEDAVNTSQSRVPISEKVLLPALYSKNITRLDGVFISHNHKDHAQGIEEILTKIPVETIYLTPKYNGEGLALQSKIPVTIIAEGSHLETKDGLSVDVFWPDPHPEASPDDKQNEASCVMALTYGKRRFLFTGDAGFETESKLKSALIDCDVLKVGHHGSKYSTDAAFLARVSPAIAVISVGKNNTYGHPAPETLKRLTAAGAKTVRTDQSGAIEIKTDGDGLSMHCFSP